VWNGSPAQVERHFLSRTSTSYPLLLRASKVGGAFGLGHTSYVLVDHEGIVRYVSNFALQDFSSREVHRAIHAALKALAESKSSGGPNTSTSERESVPDGFALLANYPNPFNAATSIGFSLDVESELSLRIFDTSGRSVRSLLVGRRGAGSLQVTWDGRDDDGRQVSSGVYFYSLGSRGRRATRSMVLLR
jgi:hypothetical protein